MPIFCPMDFIMQAIMRSHADGRWKKSFMPIRSSRNSNTPNFVIAFRFCLKSLSLDNICSFLSQHLQDETLVRVTQSSSGRQSTRSSNSSRGITSNFALRLSTSQERNPEEVIFVLGSKKACCEQRPLFPNYSSCKNPSADSCSRKLPLRDKLPPVKLPLPLIKPPSPSGKPPSPPVTTPSRPVQQTPSPQLVQQPQQDIKSTVCIIQNFGGHALNCLPNCSTSCKPSCPLPVLNSYEPEPEPKAESNTEIEIEMAQDIGSCCAKYILCLFNFIFFVSIKDSI